MPPLPVLSPDQSAAWDASAVAGGVALATLMECAGRAAAAVLAARYAHRLRDGVLVAAGPGHNGGDGWVARAGAPPARGAGLGHRARRHRRRAARADGRARARRGRARGRARRALAQRRRSWSTRCSAPAPPARPGRRSPRCSSGCSISRCRSSRSTGRPASTCAPASCHGAPRADLLRSRSAGSGAAICSRATRSATWWWSTSAIRRADPAWPTLVTDAQAADWLRRLRSARPQGRPRPRGDRRRRRGDDRCGPHGRPRGVRRGRGAGARRGAAGLGRRAGAGRARSPDSRAPVRPAAVRRAARPGRAGPTRW